MAGITLVQAQQLLNAWVACELALAQGAQSYTIGTRTFTRAQLKDVGDQVKYYNTLVQQLSRGGGLRVRYATT